MPRQENSQCGRIAGQMCGQKARHIVNGSDSLVDLPDEQRLMFWHNIRSVFAVPLLGSILVSLLISCPVSPPIPMPVS